MYYSHCIERKKVIFAGEYSLYLVSTVQSAKNLKPIRSLGKTGQLTCNFYTLTKRKRDWTGQRLRDMIPKDFFYIAEPALEDSECVAYMYV